MSTAYVDSSYALAILFGAADAAQLEGDAAAFTDLVCSNLLEAEVRSAAAREQVKLPVAVLAPFRWIYPDRPLTAEIEQVLAAGYLRGADAYHLACALFFFEDPRRGTLLTCDARQREVATQLGFATGRRP